MTIPAGSLQVTCVLLDLELQLHDLLLKVMYGMAANLGSFQQAPGSLQCIPCSPLPPGNCT